MIYSNHKNGDNGILTFSSIFSQFYLNHFNNVINAKTGGTKMRQNLIS